MGSLGKLGVLAECLVHYVIFFFNRDIGFLCLWLSVLEMKRCSRFYSTLISFPFCSTVHFSSYAVQAENHLMQGVTENHIMQCGCGLAKIDREPISY